MRMRVLDELLAHDPLQTALLLGLAVRRRQNTDALAVVLEFKAHVETRQRKTPQQLIDLAELGAVRAQELAARRNVVEQVFHVDPRARL